MPCAALAHRALVPPPPLLQLPEDVVRTILRELGVPVAGAADGLSPLLAPALALCETHPVLAGHIARALPSLALTFTASCAPEQAAAAVRAAGTHLRDLSLRGPDTIPPPAWRAILSAPTSLRTLSLSRLPTLSDLDAAALLTAQPELEAVHVAAVQNFGPRAASALGALVRLSSLSLADVPGLHAPAVVGVLLQRGSGLRELALHVPHAVAVAVGAFCPSLERLALGPGAGHPDALVAACPVTLRAAALPPGLAESHARALVDRCSALEELSAPGLPPRVLADVVGHRLRRLELALPAVAAAEVDALAARCTRLAALRVAGGAAPAVLAALGRLVKALGTGLVSFEAVEVAALDDDALGGLGEAAGALYELSIDALDNVSAKGFERLVRANGATLARVAVGPKCRRLTNVAIMRVLGKHCGGLRAVSFPRWSLAKRAGGETQLDAAVAAFRRAAPAAHIVAG